MQLRISVYNCLSTLFVFILLNSSWISFSEARSSGGRFGGSRSFSRSSTFGTRGSRYSRNGYSAPSRLSSVRYKTVAAAAAVGVVVYGLSRYRTRFYGSRYYREDPDLCTNLYRNATYENGTTSQTEKLTWFVCPYDLEDDEGDNYCCGPKYQQYCCSYWKSPSKVAGVVVGIVIAVIVISVAVCCICQRRKLAKRRDPRATGSGSGTATYHAAPTAPPSDPPMAAPTAPPMAPYGQPMGYGPPNYAMAPTQPGTGIGFEGVGSLPPPSYETALNQPQKM